MEKLVYLLNSELPPNALREALLGPIANDILNKEVFELEVYVRDQTGPLAGTIENHLDPYELMDASVSIWLNNLDDRAQIEAALHAVSRRIAGYSVTESVPREYQQRNWNDGELSPTITVANAFCEVSGLDNDTFFKRWHGSHTPLSLNIHPLTRYVRNTVSRVLTPDSPPFRGLVFESVASLEVLADCDAFYGGEANRQQAVQDLCSFADLKTLCSVAMSETIVRSAPWR